MCYVLANACVDFPGMPVHLWNVNAGVAVYQVADHPLFSVIQLSQVLAAKVWRSNLI